MITSDHDFERMKGKQNIYIYGAGNMADAVYGHLAGNQCAVKGFVVSRTLNFPWCRPMIYRGGRRTCALWWQ